MTFVAIQNLYVRRLFMVLSVAGARFYIISASSRRPCLAERSPRLLTVLSVDVCALVLLPKIKRRKPLYIIDKLSIPSRNSEDLSKMGVS